MSEITYSENLKTAVFNGLKFIRGDKTGYYLNATSRKRLHRHVWECHNGLIPKKHHIHHINGDKSNNNLSNLQLMTLSKHLSKHGKERAVQDKEWFDKFHSAGIEKAKIWHASVAGKEWHNKHYESMKEKLHEKVKKKCINCGKLHETGRKNSNNFCSNKCKSAWRRKSGIDNETRICESCGCEYETNKYSKQRTCSKTCSNKKYPRLPQLRAGVKN